MLLTAFLTKLVSAAAAAQHHEKRETKDKDPSPLRSPFDHLLDTNGNCDPWFNSGCKDGSKCLSLDRLAEDPYWDCWKLAPPRRHNKSQRKANWCEPDEDLTGCGEDETCILTEPDEVSPWYQCFVPGETKPRRRPKKVGEPEEEEDE
jgi:hypothetical protein